ncbi:40S ribosomal protein mrp10 [Ciborinia camelliae]|nr:40S ribosomal protein mrp10 [Ciborinia camelliae]
MPPKGASTAKVPMRLPPLPKLRVRRPNQTDSNPCMAIMTSVLKSRSSEKEHDQLPSLTDVPEDRWTAKEEMNGLKDVYTAVSM